MENLVTEIVFHPFINCNCPAKYIITVAEHTKMAKLMYVGAFIKMSVLGRLESFQIFISDQIWSVHHIAMTVSSSAITSS